VQALFAVLALAAVAWTFRRPRDPLVSYAVLVTATLAATPYLMSYDLAVVSWLILALAHAGKVGDADRRLLLAVQFLPLLAIAGELWNLPGSALVLPALAAVLVWRLADRSRSAASAGAAGGNASAA
jgi:hypothetical protein